MDAIASALEVLLGALLVVAALGKLAAWKSWMRARVDMRVAIPLVLWNGLPLVELLVGVGLALGVRPWAGAAGVALFLIFAAVLALSTARGAEGECNCFGAILPVMIGRGAIVRALALALVAAVALTTGFEASELHPLGLILAVSGGAAAFMLMSLWESLNPAR